MHSHEQSTKREERGGAALVEVILPWMCGVTDIREMELVPSRSGFGVEVRGGIWEQRMSSIQKRESSRVCHQLHERLPQSVAYETSGCAARARREGESVSVGAFELEGEGQG